MDKELRYHFERLVEDFRAQGLGEAEARRRARLEFGGLGQIEEECRDVRGRWLADFTRDLRYAARSMRRNPGFVAVAVVSLALGIGANTAIFRLIDAVMLRRLPVREPERLVRIARLGPDGSPYSVSYALFDYLRANLKTIAMSALEMESAPAVVIDGNEEIVPAELVSGEHFPMLGIAPAAGRLLAPADDAVTGSEPVAVIGYRYWRRRFGADPAAVGKKFTLQIQNKVVTIVGVMPAGFGGARQGFDPDVILPATTMQSDEVRREPTSNWLDLLARLRPGVSIGRANAEAQVVYQSFLARVGPSIPEKDRARWMQQRIAVLPGSSGIDDLRYGYARALLVLMGIVALVLLLACANLSGMLLARAAARQREISIRLAIGASAGRLIRQFLTESFLLAAIGGAAGLVLARWFSGVLVTMMANGGTKKLTTETDWQVLGFTSAVSAAVCVLAGLAPGWHAAKPRRVAGTQRVGKALVVAQLAISMVLVVGATLFTRTLANLYTVDTGVRPEGVLAFRVRANERYAAARQWSAVGALLDRLNGIPGVAAASTAEMLALTGGSWTRHIQVAGRTFANDDSAFNAVAPRYFATVGTPLVMGRDFDVRDGPGASKVAIVNESFARYFLGGTPPLGQRVKSLNVTYEVVGVVKDAKFEDLRRAPMRTIYVPWDQRDAGQPNALTFLVRVGRGDPMQIAPMLPEVVREADPGLRIRLVERYSTWIGRTIVTERIMATLGGFFGVLALIVAGIGMFGVMAFQVSRRAGEIGVRIALGASRGAIVRLVLRDLLVIVGMGTAIGSVMALMVTGMTRKMLFGVTPRDPAVFVVAAMVLGIAALVAGWLPARRASRMDPLLALRRD